MNSNPTGNRILPALSLVIGLAGLILGIVAVALYATGPRSAGPDPTAAAPESESIDHAGYAVSLVEEAIDYYRANGRAGAIERYSRPDAVDGPWYAFIVDEDDLFVAHYDPNVVGESLHGPTGIDATGYAFGPAMAGADEDGRWVRYVFLNPESGQQQAKNSWVVRHDGLLFGSGWYEFAAIPARETEPGVERPAEFTKAFVDRAIEYYDREGRDAMFEHYKSPDSALGDWYLFVIDPAADELVVHQDPGLLGARISQLTDRHGYNYGPDLLSAGADGKWVSFYLRTYLGDTPVAEGDKHAWAVRHDGLIFGSGWYENLERLPAPEIDPGGYTQWFVQQAAESGYVLGREGLLERYGDPSSVEGPWSLILVDAQTTDILAHAADPDQVGRSVLGRAGVDLVGNHFGRELLAADSQGRWLGDLYLTNPASGACEKKHTWAVRRGDLILASGWYESPAENSLLPSPCEQAHYTVATVRRAVERYRADGPDAAIAFHNSPQSMDGRWYTFIVDANSGEIVAHPAETFVGVDITGAPQGYGDAWYNYSADLMRTGEEGKFVRDVISVPTIDERNPFHTIEEVKHYYAERADDLIFVSGWYTPPPTKADPAEYARLLVGRALTRYDDEGAEATLAFYNRPEAFDGPWYVFGIEDVDGVLYSVANANPGRVGTTWERIDRNGFDYGAAFAAVTEEGGGEWVDYVFTHPQTGEDAPKHSWVVRRDEYIFGVGWYEGIGE